MSENGRWDLIQHLMGLIMTPKGGIFQVLDFVLGHFIFISDDKSYDQYTMVLSLLQLQIRFNRNLL